MEINNSTNFNYGQKLAALLLITGVICSVAWLSPQHNENRKMIATKTNGGKGESKKISKAEKFQTLFVSPSIVKEQVVDVKPQVKKAVTKSIKQLKELKELSLKEITALEYRRLHLLLQESKKEISRKRLDKYNVNKFLFANGATFTRSLADNAKLLPYKALLNSIELSGQQLSVQDFQKMVVDLDKAQFAFSFECVDMENHLHNALTSEHFKTFHSKELHPSRSAQKLKNAEVEKIKNVEVDKHIHTDGRNSAERELRRVYVNRVPATVAGARGRSVYVVDSVAREAKPLYRSHETVKTNNTNIVKNKTAAEAEVTAYAYTYDTDVIIVEGKLHKVQGKNLPKPNASGGSQLPATTEISVYYHVTPHGSSAPRKINVPKPKTQPPCNDNIRVEYKPKNGVIVMNGIKVDQSEHNIVAVTLKGKKVLSRAKNLMEHHIDN